MTSVAFIIGTLIIGLCLVAGAFIISGAVTGAAAAAKESAPQSLQQPTLSFLTEFDAADYLGISLNELDYMRGEGMLENTFVAVTSMEQTGEEEYYAMEDGVEVIKVRPVMSPVTRFLFNRQLLDERMLEIIKQGQHVNPTRQKNSSKPNKNKNGQKNGQKNANRPERRDNDGNSQNNRKSSDRPDNSGKNNDKRPERPNNGRDGDNRPKKSSDRPEGSDKSSKKFDDAPVKSTKPTLIDDDDEIFAKPTKASSLDDDFFGSSSKASITIGDDDDDAFDLDVFGRGDVPAPSSKFDRRRND